MGSWLLLEDFERKEDEIMEIPKIIHYCWFGGNPHPQMVLDCIQSWKKYCPDYQIIEWNETNFNVNEIQFTKEAYENKKWAFVSDYARLKILFDHGGIYLDTDVELIRSLDPFLNYQGFMGFENQNLVASGLGFGAVKGHPVIQALMDDYQGISYYKENGLTDETPCPERNTARLCSLGLIPNGNRQTVCNMEIFPSEYFAPMNWETGKMFLTDHTYSIHHYHASWLSKKEQRWLFLRRKIGTPLYNKLRYEYRIRFKRFIKKWLIACGIWKSR